MSNESRPTIPRGAYRRIEIADEPAKPLWEMAQPAPLNPKPRLRIPGNDRLTSNFAQDLAQNLGLAGIFVFNGTVVVENSSRTALEKISAIQFVTWVEGWVATFRMKGEAEVPRSMSGVDAARVLVAGQFLSGLRQVDRYNPIRMPVFDHAGNLALLPTGYHADTRTLTTSQSICYDLDWPKQRATDLLADLLAEFPFAEAQRSKATIVAAMLTVYGLHLLSPTCEIPAFVYTANSAGCGKGLCCKLAGMPVFGSVPTGVLPATEHEIEKVLFAAACDGLQLLFFDNVDRHLASASLESFLTTSRVSGRIMGKSKMMDCPKKTVVLISGNNCTVREDMRRRSLFVEYFMEELQPEHRHITKPLDEAAILGKRKDILSALYTLAREWADAKRPQPSRVLQGFSEWSRIIAGIVEHAGYESPIPRPETSIADEELQEIILLVNALQVVPAPAGVTFSQLVQTCQTNELMTDKIRPSGNLSKSEKTSFSRLLKRYAGRIFPGGVRFAVTGVGHARRYRIQPLATDVDPAHQAAAVTAVPAQSGPLAEPSTTTDFNQ